MLSALISIFYLRIRYCALELKKNIVRLSHENIRIFKEFRSIVNMLRALILLTRKCHNIIKHSFNENVKELDYLLISYRNWNVLHFPHSALSTLRTFHTPHFPHSIFSTLRTFHTPHFPHSSLSTLLIFHTPHFPHSALSTLLIFHTFHTPHPALRVFHRTLPRGHLRMLNATILIYLSVIAEDDAKYLCFLFPVTCNPAKRSVWGSWVF